MSASEDFIGRRLRPIYDAIDSRNFKLAVKLSSKKDVADVPVVRVLRAYSLQHSGRREEAIALVDSAVKEEAILRDPNVLSTAELVYRIAGKFDKATKAYENAVQYAPKNESLLSTLLQCYVRCKQYDKLQMLGMKMWKTFSNDSYALWAVIGILLDVKFGTCAPSLQRLKLAKMLTQKLDRDGPIASEGGLDLRLRIHEALGEHDDRLGLIRLERTRCAEQRTNESNAERIGALRAREGEFLSMEAAVMAEMGDYQGAMLCYWDLLANHDSKDWACHKKFVDCAAQSCVQINSDAAPMKDARKRLRGLEASRGVHWGLAYLDFVLLSKAESAAPKEFEEISKSYVASLSAYVETYGDRKCCFSDLRKFLVPMLDSSFAPAKGAHSPTLPDSDTTRLCESLEHDFCERNAAADDPPFVVREESRSSFAALLNSMDDACYEAAASALSSCDQTEKSIYASSKTLEKYTTVVKIKSFLGMYVEKEGKDVGVLMNRLDCLYNLCPTQQNQRGVQVGDDLVLLLAPFIAARDGDISALALLERGRDRSPYNFQIKLLQMSIYGRLRAFVPCCEFYNALKIRFIQLDSLSYLITGLALETGFLNEAERSFNDIGSLRWQTLREVPEYVKLAWKHHNYAEILDFARLNERLRCSHQLAVARAEGHNLALLDNIAGAHEFLHKQLFDLRLNYALTLGYLCEGAGKHGSPSLGDLCINYDFEVQETWEFPFCETAKASIDALSHSRSCAACPGAAALRLRRGRKHWKARSNLFLSLRTSVPKVLFYSLEMRPVPLRKEIERCRLSLGQFPTNSDLAFALHGTFLKAADALLLLARIMRSADSGHRLREPGSLLGGDVNIWDQDGAKADAGAACGLIEQATSELSSFFQRIELELSGMATESFFESNLMGTTSYVLCSPLCWLSILTFAVSRTLPRRKKGKKPSVFDAPVRQMRAELVGGLKRIEASLEPLVEHFAEASADPAFGVDAAPTQMRDSQAYFTSVVRSIRSSHSKSSQNLKGVASSIISFLKKL